MCGDWALHRGFFHQHLPSVNPLGFTRKWPRSLFRPVQARSRRNARDQDGTRTGRDGPHLGTWMGPKCCKTKHMANLDGTPSDPGWGPGRRFPPKKGLVFAVNGPAPRPPPPTPDPSPPPPFLLGGGGGFTENAGGGGSSRRGGGRGGGKGQGCVRGIWVAGGAEAPFTAKTSPLFGENAFQWTGPGSDPDEALDGTRRDSNRLLGLSDSPPAWGRVSSGKEPCRKVCHVLHISFMWVNNVL